MSAIKRETRFFLCRTDASSSDIEKQKEQLISQEYLAAAILGSTETTKTLEKGPAGYHSKPLAPADFFIGGHRHAFSIH